MSKATEPARCAICGNPHNLRDPHVWKDEPVSKLAANASKPTVIVSNPPANLLTRIESIESRLAVLEALGLVPASKLKPDRKEYQRELMRKRRAKGDKHE